MRSQILALVAITFTMNPAPAGGSFVSCGGGYGGGGATAFW